MPTKEMCRKKREAEICYDCPNPSFPGFVRCLRCLELSAGTAVRFRREHPERIYEINRKKKQQRRDDGRCISCGGPKDPDDDMGSPECMNCRYRDNRGG